MSDEEHLVSAAEVARLAGVGRAAVSNWRRRHPDFPEPVGGSAGTRFRLTEVERWLRAQGKLPDSGGEDTLWRAVSVGRDEGEITRLLGDVLEHLHGQPGVELPGPVRDEVERIEPAARVDVAEQLCRRHTETARRRHSATTVELAELMAELSDPHGVVLDPACGLGNALRVAAERGAERVLGQELDPDLARLAQARLRFHAPASVVAGDALRADGHADVRADVVFCEPPFGYRDWGYEELSVDRRWDYGLPVKNEPELAWLQHCLAHVRPGGLVVGLLPAAVASRRSGRLVRKELVRRGVVRAVFALPAGLLATTGIPLHLWLLRAPADDDTPMSVLLVDASDHGGRARGEADWPALRSAVLEPWRACRAGEFEPMPGRHDVVQAIDLLDEDVDLTPARHLPAPRTVVDTAELEARHRRLRQLVGPLAELLPAVTERSPEPHPTLTISELARAGALTVRQHTGRLELSDSEDAVGELVLTGRDVADGVGPTLRLAGPVEAELVHLVPGDVVVPTLVAGGTPATARVIGETGLLLGPNLHLLRVDPARLDAEFLAGYLSASRTAEASSATVSGARRLDVRRVDVPLLPVAEQRRLGRAFRAVRLFHERLREAGELADLLGRQLVDGLADGVLDVPGG
ncbi:type I restriction-modification system methyltransferase subunit [Saccharomonospora cyanea NA-134]|uniref:Type I restriction-modification system methyltransferase subunit n=1 Tax=Saccharomonospora cyanea NA-134 TaxID=882082 RepID=H5XHC3_9PSEU|nr:N-6 DNA methylase [Saccharomonospora cyanea]EHR60608.1 type I restriction-modification system methyltransferase subunit [Saccharomonospora cyanea NA-134]